MEAPTAAVEVCLSVYLSVFQNGENIANTQMLFTIYSSLLDQY